MSAKRMNPVKGGVLELALPYRQGILSAGLELGQVSDFTGGGCGEATNKEARMTTQLRNWTRAELLVAFALYLRLPCGRFREADPDIVRFAHAIDRTPSALKMKLWNIASLDPTMSAGRRSLDNASSSDRTMWDEMQNDWAGFVVECKQALMTAVPERPPSEGSPEEDTPDYLGQERVVESTARIGQEFFRTALMSAYNEQCCITGLSTPALLVASHIVPWSVDERNRVNPRNGLLLSALHDRAFDAGLLTVNEDMTVRVSRSHGERDDGFFAAAIGRYDGQPIIRPEKFEPDRRFLQYHREHIFRSG